MAMNERRSNQCMDEQECEPLTFQHHSISYPIFIFLFLFFCFFFVVFCTQNLRYCFLTHSCEIKNDAHKYASVW